MSEPVWKQEAGWTEPGWKEPERRLTGIVLPSFEDPDAAEDLDEFERDRRARATADEFAPDRRARAAAGEFAPDRHARATAAEFEPDRHARAAAAEFEPDRHARATADEFAPDRHARATADEFAGPPVPVVPAGPPPAWPPAATEPDRAPESAPVAAAPRREFPRFIHGEFVLPPDDAAQAETATLAPPAPSGGFDPLTAPVDVLEAHTHAPAAPEGLRTALPSWGVPAAPPPPPPAAERWERTPTLDLPDEPAAAPVTAPPAPLPPVPTPPASMPPASMPPASMPPASTPPVSMPPVSIAPRSMPPVPMPVETVAEPTWAPVVEPVAAPAAPVPAVEEPTAPQPVVPPAATTPQPVVPPAATTPQPVVPPAATAPQPVVPPAATAPQPVVAAEAAPAPPARKGAPHPAFPDATARTFRILPIAADLLPLEISETRHVRRVRRLVISGVVAVAALVVGWYGVTVHEHTQADEDRQSILDTSQDLTRQRHKRYDELTRVQADSGKIDERLKKVLDYDLSWSKMLAALRATAAAKNVTLSGITASLNQESLAGQNKGDIIGTVTLTGKAPTKAAVAAYVDALNGVSGVTNPFPSDATQELDGVSFTIRVDITRAALGGRFTSAAPSASPTGSK
ncbi:hypothetical protein ACQP1P_40535 [Dactylosporangium sp. CA-052675]|uniref:hypothetical protein n=1 Tax=Dactylosporangium sp. CA-052675 TaxID=3239927 RepID=UPI003D94CFA0